MINTKEKSLQKLIKEADTAFSEYIRISYADDNGKIKCSCGCGAYLPWRQMQASHYINRGNMATRYKIENVVPATGYCNYYDEDHREKIGKFLSKQYQYNGSVLDYLNSLGNSTMKFTRPELIEIRDTYKAKFNELRKQKGL